jgi:hypothetical protein
VQDRWYNDEYVPEYRRTHGKGHGDDDHGGKHGDNCHHDEDHDGKHGDKGRDDGKDKDWLKLRQKRKIRSAAGRIAVTRIVRIKTRAPRAPPKLTGAQGCRNAEQWRLPLLLNAAKMPAVVDSATHQSRWLVRRKDIRPAAGRGSSTEGTV